MQRLYTDLSPWWPLISHPEEYRDEAFLWESTLKDAVQGEFKTLLELGCGGGNNAGWFDQGLDFVLVDLEPGMLKLAQERVPRAVCLPGDMRSLRLNERFDAVFVHDAIAYMTTEEDLLAALKTVAHHLRPGGAALVCPDGVGEQFGPTTEHGGCDGEGRSARYLMWMTDPDPSDTVVRATMTYVLREDGQDDVVVHENHEWGLFPLATWQRLFDEAGMRMEIREVDEEFTEPEYANVMFVGWLKDSD